MMGFKFDEEKVTACINAYTEEHKTKPYMILNSETKKYVTTQINNYLIVDIHDIPPETYKGAKIMIDEDLKFGEILIR